MYWDSMLRCLDNSIGLARFAGPGHWNDLDMLEVRVHLRRKAACHFHL